MNTPTPPLGQAATELYARVQAAAADTPHTVTATPSGFDVAVDVYHPKWKGALARRNMNEVFTHRVKLDEPNRKLTITDERFMVGYLGADTPGSEVTHGVGTQLGRMNRRSVYKTVSRRADGSISLTDKARFSSEEGRRLITGPAEELGWTQNVPATAKIGLVFAIIGGASFLIAVVWLVVAAVTGAFG